MQRVEGVEELFLNSLAARQELDVVDQQHVVRAIPVLEVLDLLLAQRIDELVRERLARDVARSQVRCRRDVVRDRLQQMRLSEARRTVNEERVVGLAR